MIRLSLFGLAFGCATVTASASSTTVWQAASDNGFALADPAIMLPVSNLVRLGYFNQGFTDAMIAANAMSSSGLLAINAQFNEIGTSLIGNGSGNQNGYFRGNSVVLSGSAQAGAVGKQLVLWTFFSTNNTSTTQTLETALQTGIFYMDKASDGRWQIPSDSTADSFTEIELTYLTGAGSTAGLLPGAHVVVGSYSTGTAGALNARNFQLAVVPEPTSAVLLLAGLGGFGLRRFRRK